MFEKLLFVCALGFVATACSSSSNLEVPADEDRTEEEQDPDVLAPATAPSCDSACSTSTATCATAYVDLKGAQTTCDVYMGSCDLFLKAREGRNPQTGETIQIPPKTTLKR